MVLLSHLLKGAHRTPLPLTIIVPFLMSPFQWSFSRGSYRLRFHLLLFACSITTPTFQQQQQESRTTSCFSDVAMIGFLTIKIQWLISSPHLPHPGRADSLSFSTEFLPEFAEHSSHPTSLHPLTLLLCLFLECSFSFKYLCWRALT